MSPRSARPSVAGLFLAAGAIFAPPVHAQMASPSPMASPAPMASPGTGAAAGARVADVAWIAGRWVDDSKGNYSEEIWTGPAGGAMLGMWRLVNGGRVRVYELLSLSDEPEGLVLRLRHFDPRLVAREEKDRPVTLRLTDLQGARATFEGQEADGPVRLIYHRTGKDTLAVTLDRAGVKQEFRFQRKERGRAAASPRPSPAP
ncbi:MAG TPA: DUF6265 family protein [Vicinamibacteria bacterium]|nr:DUF6265 family protein [Vicinamibacteria bacterium]